MCLLSVCVWVSECLLQLRINLFTGIGLINDMFNVMILHFKNVVVLIAC